MIKNLADIRDLLIDTLQQQNQVEVYDIQTRSEPNWAYGDDVGYWTFNFFLNLQDTGFGNHSNTVQVQIRQIGGDDMLRPYSTDA